MKILQFQAENIKRLKVVQITPKGNIVEITGRNGSGKTSVLDCIDWALSGTKGIQSQPIHRGASEGTIEIDLGDIKVVRKFSSAAGPTLTVEKKDGTRVKSPQALLDSLVGKISFDPLAFGRMKAKDQFETLRSLVKLDVDLVKLDEQNASDFSKRTDINRDIKALKVQADTVSSWPADTPAEPIDIGPLTDDIAKAAAHNAAIVAEKQARLDIKANIDNLRKKATGNQQKAQQLAQERNEEIQRINEKYRKLIDAEEKEHESRLKTADSLESELARKQPVPDGIDVSAARARVDEAVAKNTAVGRRRRHEELTEKIRVAEDAAADLTANIEARDKAKRDAIASAKMPVPGLGFGKDEVMLNDLPFEQASAAEQLKTSCAIAMAMNPTLRVLRILDGSLLDSASLEMLSQMADDQEYQIWIERVEDDGHVGVVMHDGTATQYPDREFKKTEA